MTRAIVSVKIEPPIKIIRKTHKLVYDPRVWPKCHTKEVEEWAWRRLKTKKYLAHSTGKKIELIEVSGSQLVQLRRAGRPERKRTRKRAVPSRR